MAGKVSVWKGTKIKRDLNVVHRDRRGKGAKECSGSGWKGNAELFMIEPRHDARVESLENEIHVTGTLPATIRRRPKLT